MSAPPGVRHPVEQGSSSFSIDEHAGRMLGTGNVRVQTESRSLRIALTSIVDKHRAAFDKNGHEPRAKRQKIDDYEVECCLTIWNSQFSKRQEGPDDIKQSTFCTMRILSFENEPANIEIETQDPFHIDEDRLSKISKHHKISTEKHYMMQLQLIPVDPTRAWPPFELGLSHKNRLQHTAESCMKPQLVISWSKLPGLPEAGQALPIAAIYDGNPRAYKTKLRATVKTGWSNSRGPLHRYSANHRQNNDTGLRPENRMSLRQEGSPLQLPSPTSEVEPLKPEIKTRYAFKVSEYTSEPEVFLGYVCAFCQGSNFTYCDVFHFHLINNHDLFRFKLLTSFEMVDPGQRKVSVDVTVTLASDYRERASNDVPDPRVMAWETSKKLFDVEAYLKGDDNWLPEHTGKARRPESPTSLGSHDPIPRGGDHTHVMAQPIKRRHAKDVPNLTKPDRKRHVVPIPPEGVRFFRSTVKRPLKVGEEISESDDEMDESWLLQKHSDVIDSFSDNTAAENEFIRNYDTHMLKENLSSNLHLNDALVRFCRSNCEWLKSSRMHVEFHKNAAKLILLGIIGPTLVRECTDIIENGAPGGDINASTGIELLSDRTASEAPARFQYIGTPTNRPANPVESQKFPSRTFSEGTRSFGICGCGFRVTDLRELVRCENPVSSQVHCFIETSGKANSWTTGLQ
ncbi:hypothetical protein MMC09_001733 [Bachmanniomyces sp. S44760]|nr:hypothetical protein [Bachmanniomyces sp. S44760]